MNTYKSVYIDGILTITKNGNVSMVCDGKEAESIAARRMDSPNAVRAIVVAAAVAKAYEAAMDSDKPGMNDFGRILFALGDLDTDEMPIVLSLLKLLAREKKGD